MWGMVMGRRKRHGKKNNRYPVQRIKGKKIFPTSTKDRHGEEGMLNYLDKLKEAGKAAAATVFVPREECWESGIEVIKSCGTAPESIPVTIGPIAQAKINALMKEYPRIEWLAYLLGADNHVEDLIIPKQEVTPVRVDVDGHGVSVPTIGVIHSHHGMGNGFSGTDHEYINQNHDISLCISHGGIAGQVRTKTSCGKYVIVPAAVEHVVEGFDQNSFITETKKLISPKNNFYQGGGVGGHGRETFTGHHNLGLEDNPEFPVGIGDDFEGHGLKDLSDTMIDDLLDSPESYDIMDLAGVKEIVQESIKVGRNRDIFMSMYQNILENNGFDDTNNFFCVPLELMDELDTSWDTPINAMERNSLVNLLAGLEAAIELLMMELAEDSDINPENQTSDHLPTDEELWSTGDENEGEELWSGVGNVEAPVPGIEDEDIEEPPSDNLWNTGQNGSRIKTGNA